MNSTHTLLVALMSVSLLACDKPATEEDRKALTGLWIPDDGSRHTIEFKKDGVFDFGHLEQWRFRPEVGRLTG